MRHNLVAGVRGPLLRGQAGRVRQPAASAEPNDFKPASTNIVGLQYPQVNSARQVKFRVYAPDAPSLRVLGTTLTQGTDGDFTGVTRPQDPGFHSYPINVDGMEKVKVRFLGTGGREHQSNSNAWNLHEALAKAGIKSVYYESPGTSHERLTRRRHLREFAPLLFKD